MTYFGFLFIFVGIPLLILGGLAWYDWKQGRHLPAELTHWPAAGALAALVIIAVVYTTPWDNYLVATRVWWYDPALVSGVVWGWVPLEEYSFFVLQTLLTGLWILYLARHHLQPAIFLPNPGWRWRITALCGIVWLGSLGLLISGWSPGTYLALELSWALLPIIIQLAFGADILWYYGRLVFWSIIPSTLYLSLADALAIQSGTWTINPQLSLGVYLGGVLPIEEFIFFALTNTLVTFGLILALTRLSQERLATLLKYSRVRPIKRSVC